jgi:hypothetical protein
MINFNDDDDRFNSDIVSDDVSSFSDRGRWHDEEHMNRLKLIMEINRI